MTTRWTAIDFETATRERDSACALGLAVIEGDRIVERRDWLIRPPGNRFEWMNTQVHGISAADTSRAPGFERVWDEIEPYLTDSMVLAHNASFDVSVLRASLARHGLAAPRARYLCTVTMARRMWPRLPDHKLSTVCESCGIDLIHHRAESDAAACATIALRCLAESAVPTLGELAEALDMRPRSI